MRKNKKQMTQIRRLTHRSKKDLAFTFTQIALGWMSDRIIAVRMETSTPVKIPDHNPKKLVQYVKKIW